MSNIQLYVPHKRNPRIVSNILGNGLGAAASTLRDFNNWTVGFGAATISVAADGLSFTVTTDGVNTRGWLQHNFAFVSGDRYVLSFDVSSPSGTFAQDNIAITGAGGATFSGTTTFRATTDSGRFCIAFTCTGSGTETIKFGVGAADVDADETITFSKIMLERLPYQNACSEYVAPGDQAAFNYEHAITVSSTYVTDGMGTPFKVNKMASGVIFSDSFGDGFNGVVNPWGEDYPFLMRNELPHSAISTRAFTGTEMSAIYTADIIADALSLTNTDSRKMTHTWAVLQASLNSFFGASDTLAEAKAAYKLGVDAIVAAGVTPILCTYTAHGAHASASTFVQGQTDELFRWMRGMAEANGWPFYDMFEDSRDYASSTVGPDLLASWDAAGGDGFHPGAAANEGQSRVAKMLARKIRTLSD